MASTRRKPARRDSDRLRTLSEQHQELQAQVQGLSSLRRELAIRHDTVQEWADSFTMLQACLVSADPANHAAPSSAAEAAAAKAGRFEQLLHEEGELLQSLPRASSNSQASCGSSVTQQPEATSEPTGLAATISPSHNRMAMIYRLAARLGPARSTASMTAHGAACVFRRTALAVGIQLHQLETESPEEQQRTLKQMQEAWDE